MTKEQHIQNITLLLISKGWLINPDTYKFSHDLVRTLKGNRPRKQFTLNEAYEIEKAQGNGNILTNTNSQNKGME